MSFTSSALPSARFSNETDVVVIHLAGGSKEQKLENEGQRHSPERASPCPRPLSGIFGCGPDCLLKIFSFDATPVQWASLQQVCRRWHEACQLPTWISLLKLTPRNAPALMDTLCSHSVEGQRKILSLATALMPANPTRGIPALIQSKVKHILKRAIPNENLSAIRMILEFTSVNTDVDSEPLIVLSLRLSTSEIFQFLVERNADLNVRWFGQSLACRLGLGCAWSVAEKKAAFDQLRPHDHIPPELEAATLGDCHWLEELAEQRRGALNKMGILDTDEQGLTALHYACSSGQLEIAKWLLEHGISKVDEMSREGFTALTRAARNGHTDVIKYLIERRADINKKGSDWTPLLFAASEGRVETVRVLLEANALVNESDSDGLCALFLGVQCSSHEICQALLEANADVNQAKNNGWTSLHRAVVGSESLVELLLAHSAIVDAIDVSSWTPLFLAVQRRHCGVVQMLLDCGANADHLSSSYRTPIQYSLSISDVAMVKLFLRNGVDPNQTNYAGKSLLFIALETEELDVKMVQTLLEGKAIVDQAVTSGPAEGQTPLTLLANSKEPVMKVVAKLLLEGGYTNDIGVALVAGDVGIVQKFLEDLPKGDIKKNYLAPAASHGNEDVVRVLLVSNAVPEDHLLEALSCASFGGHLNVVELLVEAKAPLDAPLSGDTPFATAVLHQQSHVVEYFLKRKCDPESRIRGDWTALMEAAWFGDNSTLEVLLEANVDIHRKSLVKLKDMALPAGVTPLRMAVQKNHVGFAQRLIDAKANVHDCDPKHHETALHVAARLGYVSCVQLLLDAGASATQTNIDGKTPLYVAVKANRKEVMDLLVAAETPDLFTALLVKDLNLLAKLIEAKANVNTVKQGRTPLYVACKSVQKDAVVLLLQAKALPRGTCDDGRTPLDVARGTQSDTIIQLLVAAGVANANAPPFPTSELTAAQE